MSDTIDMGWFDLPLAALLWLGLALLAASVVLAVGLAANIVDRRKHRSTRKTAKAITDEVMGTDTSLPVPPEPPINTRVITPEGNVWRRACERYWESVEAPQVVASWPVLAGLRARVMNQPKLSWTRATAAARSAAHTEMDDFLADPQGYGGAS